jgi:hypothetical protein
MTDDGPSVADLYVHEHEHRCLECDQVFACDDPECSVGYEDDACPDCMRKPRVART